MILTAVPVAVSVAQDTGSVFADTLGRARHLTVAPSGDAYVNTWSSSYTEMKNAAGGYVVALRDTNHAPTHSVTVFDYERTTTAPSSRRCSRCE